MTCFGKNISPCDPNRSHIPGYIFFSLKQLRIHSRASSPDMARPLKSSCAKSGPSVHTPFLHTSLSKEPPSPLRILQSSPLKNAYHSIFIFSLWFPYWRVLSLLFEPVLYSPYSQKMPMLFSITLLLVLPENLRGTFGFSRTLTYNLGYPWDLCDKRIMQESIIRPWCADSRTWVFFPWLIHVLPSVVIPDIYSHIKGLGEVVISGMYLRWT